MTKACFVRKTRQEQSCWLFYLEWEVPNIQQDETAEAVFSQKIQLFSPHSPHNEQELAQKYINNQKLS